jgi:hypothetical protein
MRAAGHSFFFSGSAFGYATSNLKAQCAASMTTHPDVRLGYLHPAKL